MDILGRPSWTDYFMTLAHVVSSRSLDPSTKHGCVLVDSENSILTTGYNSPPRGCDDSRIPLIRPDKYAVMGHSEVNAICNAARNGISLRGATAYITGYPCEVCFRAMKNAGIKKIIYGSIGSACLTEETLKAIEIMNEDNGIIFVEYKNTKGIEHIFNSTLKRIDEKKDK